MTSDSVLQIIPYDQLNDWDEFVELHPKGTIFHSVAMIRTLVSTKRHTPFAYAAVSGKGQICALLVAVKISTLGTWAGSFAARSIFHAEPIYQDSPDGHDGIKLLLQKHDNVMKRSTLFSEIRPMFASPGDHDPFIKEDYQKIGYYNYELDLAKPEERLFHDLDAKCRNNIRSSTRKKLVVREVEPANELERFYAVVAESYHRAQVPLADVSLFSAAFREMPHPICRLFIADYEGEVVSAACFLAFKNRVVYWYAGAKRIPGVAGMASILWEAITKFSIEGYQCFDFCGAGWEGEEYGPGRFKAKFGGVRTNFGRYRRVYSPLKLKCANHVYQVLRGWISPTSS